MPLFKPKKKPPVDVEKEEQAKAAATAAAVVNSAAAAARANAVKAAVAAAAFSSDAAKKATQEKKDAAFRKVEVKEAAEREAKSRAAEEDNKAVAPTGSPEPKRRSRSPRKGSPIASYANPLRRSPKRRSTSRRRSRSADKRKKRSSPRRRSPSGSKKRRSQTRSRTRSPPRKKSRSPPRKKSRAESPKRQSKKKKGSLWDNQDQPQWDANMAVAGGKLPSWVQDLEGGQQPTAAPPVPNFAAPPPEPGAKNWFKAITIPGAQVRHLIGNRGAVITEITRRSGADIKINHKHGAPFGTVTITGNVEVAERLIYEQIARTSAAFQASFPGVPQMPSMQQMQLQQQQTPRPF